MINFNIPKELLVLKDYFDHKDNKACIDEFFAESVTNDADTYGQDVTFDMYLNVLDATRTSKIYGYRLMQTLGAPYRVAMISILYLISLFGDDNMDYFVETILKRHNDNLEFEKTHPPVPIESKKKVIKKRTPKVKSNSMTKEEKAKMKQALKFANITFKIKI